MITRFRIEGRNATEEKLIEELTAEASRFMKLLHESEGNAQGAWECTDDHYSGNEKRGYFGRMVFKFHPNGSVG